ncbi:MAG TPA: kelch repeat-containing protein [Polyangiaceae bacterium]|nr:kelch repeat-containing protein [Polyangiaceae bacterium]
MAYDSADASMLVFGGLNGWASGVGNTSVLGDTWRLRGSVWTQLNPARSPSARLHHRMASDTTHGKVYLFGGQGAPGATRNNELWEWSGGNWTQLCTTAPCNAMMPTARAIAGLAYDTARDRLVLVGGQEQDNSGANDMWEWDGVAWSLVCGKSAPSCGIVSRDLYGGIAYDEARRRIVYLDAGVNYEFDGVAWTRPASSSAPPFTSAVFSNVFDATRGTLVALGNYGGGAPATTPHVWEWNGACWADTVPGGGVAHGLYGQVMAYDPPNKRLVRFGGEMPWTGTPPQTYSANIWERSSL